ncbi:MAG: phage portal protein [Phycisphaeraceae bacterium]|nr:phage portal protein [Phycisphaeraceae bacterium]
MAIDQAYLEALIEEHERTKLPRLGRLWSYYRNDMQDREAGQGSHRSYRLAQEEGLPWRLRGAAAEDGGMAGSGARRETVIENDIAWRIHTLVDFMFGRPFMLQSLAGDQKQANRIELFLRRIFAVNGGVGFFQDLALLGAVYGHVDVLLRAVPAPVKTMTRSNDLRGGRGGAARGARDDAHEPTTEELIAAAESWGLEIIDAPKAIPVLDPGDYRRCVGYVLHYRQPGPRGAAKSFLDRMSRRVLGRLPGRDGAQTVRTEVWTERSVRTYEGDVGEMRLTAEETNRWGRIPVVHIQNLPQPFHYAGLSEVEPLIPLQDELNTRLSDRANRVTFQSFKMYLGKGIEKFTERAVGPGQMWATDNPEATIQEFGGDAQNPSEDAHIVEIREALDKTSSVTPLAAGLLRGRVGNLSSENALRVVLMGLLAKTERKRVCYGIGIERVCEMILHAADASGLLPNRMEERGIRIDWPSPLPENESQRLKEAKLKLELGVPAKQVLMELGYGGQG